jgi:hypothetical protein
VGSVEELDVARSCADDASPDRDDAVEDPAVVGCDDRDRRPGLGIRRCRKAPRKKPRRQRYDETHWTQSRRDTHVFSSLYPEAAGTPPSPSIDPQMIRDHDGDADALQQSIRDIQLDALKQQARLSLARPMAKERAPHWWRRSA